MSFIIMYNYATSLTCYDLGVTISLCKFWFENDTLIQVRYCHLLGIWCVFIVDQIHVDMYLKIFGCISVLNTNQI